MARRTQGAMLWFLGKSLTDPVKWALYKVGCPVDFKPGTDSKERIETTCLEQEENKTYLDGGGLSDPATASFTINADPSNGVHGRLFDMVDTGETVRWIQGWAGAKKGEVKDIVPELDEVTGEVTLPIGRSWTTFRGYVDNFPLDHDSNTIVKSSLSIQRVEGVKWIREGGSAPVVLPA